MILLFAFFILVVALSIRVAVHGFVGDLIAMMLILVSAAITGVLLVMMTERPTPKPIGADEEKLAAEQIAMLERIYRCN